MSQHYGNGKYKTWAVTCRPRDGVSDQYITNFVEFVKKRCQYYAVVTEMKDEARHIHAALILTKPTTRGNFERSILEKFYAESDAKEIDVGRKGIKLWYNGTWTDKYMVKDPNLNMVECNLPEWCNIDHYFPPKGDTGLKKDTEYKGDRRYLRLEKWWYEYTSPGTEITIENVKQFLWDLRHKHRKIDLHDSMAKFIRTSNNLYYFLLKDSVCPYDERDFMFNR